MIERRYRLAWFVLLASVLACISLIVLVPLVGNAVVQNASRELSVTVQANQGTVGIRQGGGESVALFAGEPAIDLNPRGSIVTNSTDTALLFARTPDDLTAVARIQVYGNTNLEVEDAFTPRFNPSTAEHNVHLQLDTGRMIVTVPEFDGRPVKVIVDTPQGEFLTIDPGQYSVVTTNTETQVAVLEGKANLIRDDQLLSLQSDERGILLSEGLVEGPLDSERNLVQNGDFSNSIENWLPLASNVEIEGQQPVELTVTDAGPESFIRFSRVGIGHADAGLRQIINRDITDFQSLVLSIGMEISEQSLGVCGQQGSECPIIVRIEYVDRDGVDQTWQQGFYSIGSISQETPDVCVACPPPLNEHQVIPYQQPVFYESENLIEKLDQLGIPPAQVKSITIISSGHTFDTIIDNITLMARE